MEHVTVIGGGLGGLTAAVTAREQGHAVTLHEAHARLGGRAWTAPGARRANWGPHVVYSDGPLWRWLDERGLARPAHTFPKTARLIVREDGRRRRMPSIAVGKAIMRLRKAVAPVDRSFTDWTYDVIGDETVIAKVASFVGVATFHHDPGSLSAAFVVERLRRTTMFPPAVRYMPGGWATMVARIAAYARTIGVDIETCSRVDELPAHGPVIVAVPLRAASALLGEELTWTGARTALLDVAVTKRGRDAFAIADLDECGWAETFSMADPALAPDDEHLVQAQIGIRPHEPVRDAITRIERLLDAGFHDWRDRERWRRPARVEAETGAVDLPGTSWKDRPAIDRGSGIYLVGDMVAAPGLLAEVSVTSAMAAVHAMTERVPVRVAS